MIEDGILSMAAHAIGMDDAPTFQKFGKTHFVSTRNFYVDAKRNADWDDWVCVMALQQPWITLVGMSTIP